MNQDLKIDGMEFRGVTTLSPRFESDVPKYKVDQGFSITDHIGIKPIQFEIYLKLYDGVKSDGTETTRQEQYDKIMTLWSNRRTFIVESDFGVFTDMAITRFEPTEEGKSANTYDCVLNVEKIIRAIISLFETPIVYEEDGTIVEVGSLSGSGTEIALTVVDSLSPEEKSWAEKLIEWATEW